MLNFFKALAFFVLWATIALTTHYFITHKYFNNCSISSNKKEEINTSTSISKFYVLDSNDTIYSSDIGITIYKNIERVEVPQNLILKLAEAINSNYSKRIHLSTSYSSEENPTLADSRNLNVLEILTTNNISKNRIELSTKRNNVKFNSKNTYNNGVQITISQISQSEINSIETSIISKRLHLNIIEGNLQKTEDFISYFKLLKQYIDLHPSKIITITGHTDNKGYFQNNLVKGQNKADKLKEYFISQGFNSNQIKTDSKGEAEPIANKYTEEGKKLNNRIEININ